MTPETDKCVLCLAECSKRQKRTWLATPTNEVLAFCANRYARTEFGKNRRRVMLLSRLVVNGCQYVLRASAQHLGESAHGGHYLAWVRAHGSYCIYDEGCSYVY
jgi:hypothetical protein